MLLAKSSQPVRVLDELLWSIRRAGFAIATSQAIDVARAVRAIGYGDRSRMRDAIAAIVVTRARDRERFDAAFDGYFAREPRRTLFERLEAEGFAAAELDALRELLGAIEASRSESGTALGGLLGGGAELDRLLQLTSSAQLLSGMQSRLQSGFYVHRLLDQVGLWKAQDALASLRSALVDALGQERADAMVAALKKELSRSADEVRRHVNDAMDRREAETVRGAGDKPLDALDDREVEEVRRAVRAFVLRLRGGDRVRRRHARRGRVDPHRTLRRAMRTGGVPFVVARKARRPDKPKLILLCDVSDSVRSVARFLLELAYAAQELFSGTRSFVFVSDLGETTRLFAEEPIATALGRAYSGAIIPVTHNSNYGRVLASFADRVLGDVDRRTTVVILGDGRTNYQAESADVLDRIRERARALVWLCPEPRAAWATGDSAMPRYAPKCTRVLEVRSARDLEDAARLLVRLR